MSCGGAVALEPDELLAIANKDIAESMGIAQYYCRQCDIPDRNILALPVGANLKDTISGQDYEKKFTEPIHQKFFTHKLLDKSKCLPTIYCVPIKVGKRRISIDKEKELRINYKDQLKKRK